MEEKILLLITGQLNQKEENEAFEAVDKTSENKEEYTRLLNLWALSSQNGQYKKADQKDVENFQSLIQGNKKLPFKRMVGIFMKYAAVIVITFLSVKIIYQPKEIKVSENTVNQITVPLGSKSSLILPDGTEVLLNAGSKLTYDFSYGKVTREVSLIGEGYFKVAKQKDKPFIVFTSKAKIRALGTEFNVKAYPDENEVEAILVEGSIQINKIGLTYEGSKSSESILLKPGQKMLISGNLNENTGKDLPKPGRQNEQSESGENTITQVANLEVETSWKDEKWIIQGERLDQLAVLLSRRYNVSIELNDKELIKYKFSATIQNETIEQIFSIMKLAIPMTYKIDKGNVTWFLNRNLEKDYNEVYKK